MKSQNPTDQKAMSVVTCQTASDANQEKTTNFYGMKDLGSFWKSKPQKINYYFKIYAKALDMIGKEHTLIANLTIETEPFKIQWFIHIPKL